MICPTPIQLTEEHKSKLLEMCKALFPELQKKAYDITVKYYGSKEAADMNYGGFYITGDNHIQCSYPIDSHDDSFHQHLIESIHWFEFCMTHLRRKLNIHHDDLFLTTNTGVDTFIHPVDHLYEKFKNLSLK